MQRSLNYRQPFFVSVLFHVVVLTVLVASFEFNGRNYVVENSDKDIVNAVVVDSSKIKMASPTPISAPKIEKAPKKILPPAPVKQPPPAAKVQEAKKIPEVKPQVKPQEHTIAIPNKQKQLKKELLEKELLADLKKQTTIHKKLTKQKELEKAFEKELRAQAAKSLQQQLLSEQQRLSSAQAEKMRGVVDKYKALITQSIAQHWLVPNGVNKSLSSQLLIKIAPGGTVLDVQLVKSSGDDALDRSARSAVFKASPLPVPADPEDFEPFRQFILKVKPEIVVTRE